MCFDYVCRVCNNNLYGSAFDLSFKDEGDSDEY